MNWKAYHDRGASSTEAWDSPLSERGSDDSGIQKRRFGGAPRHQGKGTGTRLLKLAQKMRGTLELSVYAENERAVEFYRKHGFEVVGQAVEEATGHLELTMRFGG